MAIEPGQTVTNGLRLPAEIDLYTFTGQSNDAVTIFLTRTLGALTDPWLELHGPNGILLVPNQLGEGLYDLIQAYRLPRTGTYRILVRDDVGDLTFNYALSLVKIPGPNVGEMPIAPGQTVTNGLHLPAEIDLYTFFAIAGDSIEAVLTRITGSSTEAIFQLLAPDGTILAAQTSSISARNRLNCLSQTGIYVFLCRDDDGSVTFDYTITLRQWPGPPPPGAPPEYLQIFRCTNEVTVRWSAAAGGFTLQSTEMLPATTWSNIPPPYTEFSGWYYVPAVQTTPTKFYRLISTNTGGLR
jgi:hypothetical protein